MAITYGFLAVARWPGLYPNEAVGCGIRPNSSRSPEGATWERVTGRMFRWRSKASSGGRFEADSHGDAIEMTFSTPSSLGTPIRRTCGHPNRR